MKTSMLFPRRCLPVISAICILSTAMAADTNAPVADMAGATTAAPSAGLPAVSAPQTQTLPYGLADVVKLARAQVSDDVIINYIRSTGTIYNLSPGDIVYLRDQGVSDRVVSAMLDQRRRAVESVTPQPMPPGVAPGVPNAPPVPDANTVPPAPYYSGPPPGYDQTAPQPVEPAPAPSTTYVIPYTPVNPYYPYYDYGYSYPYWGGYYGGPVVTFGFGGFYGGFHHYGDFGHFGGGHFGGGHFGGRGGGFSGGHGGGHR
ncbi:MAG TPA: hypothetical protein VG146_19425 [Verrucomicrobiae bacterium]|nr:hypothetical protein [Verrucomicrobiae bacterium]